MEARRMGRLLKRALAVSKEALSQSGIEVPDIIVTGTGLGCIENTELFLDALCHEGEEFLKPTHFMQSTHNTISSLMAIQLGCHGYNSTYAHKCISFDTALNDAIMQLHGNVATATKKTSTALVGGHDEVTPTFYNLLSKIGYLGNTGEMASECSTAVVIGTEKRECAMCRIADITMLYQPSTAQLAKAVEALLSHNGLTLSSLAGVLNGYNGSETSRHVYCDSYRDIFADVPMLHYKHLFGECYTASAHALYVAACCIAEQDIPLSLIYPSADRFNANEAIHARFSSPSAILLHNADDGKNHSLTLLTAV